MVGKTFLRQSKAVGLNLHFVTAFHPGQHTGDSGKEWLSLWKGENLQQDQAEDGQPSVSTSGAREDKNETQTTTWLVQV